MPDDRDTHSYDSQSDSYRKVEDEVKETKYITTSSDPSEEKEKYMALEAEVQKTWWDNQTNRTCVAGLISIAFIALIAALVFLLPCTDDELQSTMEPDTAEYVTELVYKADGETV